MFVFLSRYVCEMNISFSGCIGPDISDTELIIKQLNLDEITMLSDFHVKMKDYLRLVIKNENLCHFYPSSVFAEGLGRGQVVALWAFVQEYMVACGALFLPASDREAKLILSWYEELLRSNRSIWVPFRSLDLSRIKPCAVAHLENGCVAPEYQGFWLHRFLIQKRLQLAAQHWYQHIFATVDPENLASLKNLLRLGFDAIAYDADHYDGKRRFVLYRSLSFGPECRLNYLSDEKRKKYMNFADKIKSCTLALESL